MTPLLFEALLFLKVNSTYWNECTVKKAMDKVKSEKVQNRLKEDTQRQQLADTVNPHLLHTSLIA